MKAIIVGGGKVGFYLAKTLREQDYSITLIEKSREQCRLCSNELDAEVIYANGTTVEAMEACGADKADCVIAVMGKDESNLVCCQIAKKMFGVKKTIAKVNNPKNTDALKELGVDIVISATDSIIKLLENEVDFSSIKEIMAFGDSDAAIVEIILPDNYALEGKALAQLELPQGCNIACISRGGRAIIPRGGTMLLSGDVLFAVVLSSAERELKRALKIKD